MEKFTVVSLKKRKWFDSHDKARASAMAKVEREPFGCFAVVQLVGTARAEFKVVKTKWRRK